VHAGYITAVILGILTVLAIMGLYTWLL